VVTLTLALRSRADLSFALCLLAQETHEEFTSASVCSTPPQCTQLLSNGVLFAARRVAGYVLGIT
jgi:hypothetical protein